MANIIPAVLGVASFVQSTKAQKSANDRANRASRGQEAVTDEQLQFFRDLIRPYAESGFAAGTDLAPGIGAAGRKALGIASSYDPEQEFAGAKREYDRSLKSDVANVRLPMGLRGLKDSSADATATGGVLARRAFDLSQLRLGMPQRALGVIGQGLGIGAPAFQSLNPAAISQGAAGSLPGAAQSYGNMANFNYGQAAAINPFKSLQGLNWDWLKMRKPQQVGATG